MNRRRTVKTEHSRRRLTAEVTPRADLDLLSLTFDLWTGRISNKLRSRKKRQFIGQQCVTAHYFYENALYRFTVDYVNRQ